MLKLLNCCISGTLTFCISANLLVSYHCCHGLALPILLSRQHSRSLNVALSLLHGLFLMGAYTPCKQIFQ
jgi:hypothetical protein